MVDTSLQCPPGSCCVCTAVAAVVGVGVVTFMVEDDVAVVVAIMVGGLVVCTEGVVENGEENLVKVTTLNCKRGRYGRNILSKWQLWIEREGMMRRNILLK